VKLWHGSVRLGCAVEERVWCDGDMSGRYMAMVDVVGKEPKMKRLIAGN
jgi:hypothetical protein